jgi:hypothetical protein
MDERQKKTVSSLDSPRGFLRGRGRSPEVQVFDLFHAPVYTHAIGTRRQAMTESGAGTVSLFDGETLQGWKILDKTEEHSWSVIAAVSLAREDSKRFEVQPGNGIFYNGPEGVTSDLFTEYLHGDCRLHVEFVVPKGSNSGVYFMGRYEVQILDSWGATELKYGTCGGIYAQWIDGGPVGGAPPRLNASKPPGQWQSYDVTFQAPRFDEGGTKISNAKFIEVVWNGQVVHEGVEVGGPTRAAPFEDEKPMGPLMLQGDHGPVAYRNIRLTPLTAE